MSDFIVYSKARCPYCDRAKQLLTHKGIEYKEVRVDLDPAKLQEMLAISDGRRTLPQIFINGKGIGGFTELWALEQKDELTVLTNS
jgi:glutaredoxin 3